MALLHLMSHTGQERIVKRGSSRAQVERAGPEAGNSQEGFVKSTGRESGSRVQRLVVMSVGRRAGVEVSWESRLEMSVHVM